MLNRLSKTFNNSEPKSPGFTIIEVVIVLAIAGLIFAVVFIAVPQLQAAQRDSAREDAMGRLEAAITQYQSRNGGNVPNSGQVPGTLKSQNYLKDFADPIGGNYTRNWPPSYENGVIYYRKGYVCNSAGTAHTSTGAGSNNYALVYMLEQGGRQCRDNT